MHFQNSDLETVDSKVGGAAECDEEVGDGDHDVHVVTPHLLVVRALDNSPEFYHVDVGDDAMTSTVDEDDEDEDGCHVSLSLLSCTGPGESHGLGLYQAVDQQVEEDQHHEGNDTQHDGGQGCNLN